MRAQTSALQAADYPDVDAARRAPRAYAIDALRGLGFLGVVLSAAEPYAGALPAWMYHAQEPPPAFAFKPEIAGLTLIDLVFPFFLFTMGAAIPLALTRRLERGETLFGIVRHGVVTRFVMLLFLALFREHFDTAAVDATSAAAHQPEAYGWLLALAGFPILFAIFTRFEGWPRARVIAVRAAGWIGAALMLTGTHFPDGASIHWHQLDIILVIIAYGVAIGTVVWLLTRENLLARLAIVAILAAIRMNDGHDGWIQQLYAFQPMKGWYDFAVLQYLCIAIPGTMVGDLLVEWAQRPNFDVTRQSLFLASDAPRVRYWSAARAAGVALALVACVPAVLVGVQGRDVLPATVVVSAICAGAAWATRRADGPTDELIRDLVRWGSFWLLLGLLLDPAEGGTHKDPPTFAWMFQSVGLAIFVLAALVVVIQILRRRRWVQLLVDNGENPMLAYVTYGMLLQPLFGLSGIKPWLDDRLGSFPWLYFFVWTLPLTVAVAYVVSFFTRRRVFWRS